MVGIKQESEMCECYQIGGRFIAEDPDCEVHGIQAQQRGDDREVLRGQIETATTIEELRSLMLVLIDTLN
jgi:hypothetical protein